MKGDELKQRTKEFALRIMEGELIPKDKVEPLKKEAEEITAIMAASRITAQGKQ